MEQEPRIENDAITPTPFQRTTRGFIFRPGCRSCTLPFLIKGDSSSQLLVVAAFSPTTDSLMVVVVYPQLRELFCLLVWLAFVSSSSPVPRPPPAARRASASRPAVPTDINREGI
eukprot:scaffold16701_cov64-Cyclotella_meneghiniana.AAC.2